MLTLVKSHSFIQNCIHRNVPEILISDSVQHPLSFSAKRRSRLYPAHLSPPYFSKANTPMQRFLDSPSFRHLSSRWPYEWLRFHLIKKRINHATFGTRLYLFIVGGGEKQGDAGMMQALGIAPCPKPNFGYETPKSKTSFGCPKENASHSHWLMPNKVRQ